MFPPHPDPLILQVRFSWEGPFAVQIWKQDSAPTGGYSGDLHLVSAGSPISTVEVDDLGLTRLISGFAAVQEYGQDDKRVQLHLLGLRLHGTSPLIRKLASTHSGRGGSHSV